MKTHLTCGMVVCALLFLSGCGANPQSMILGKWESEQAPGIKLAAEFNKDGKATLTMPLVGKVDGTYKVLSSDELEWTMGGKTTKYKMKLTATQMELTNEGKTITYKKV